MDNRREERKRNESLLLKKDPIILLVQIDRFSKLACVQNE